MRPSKKHWILSIMISFGLLLGIFTGYSMNVSAEPADEITAQQTATPLSLKVSYPNQIQCGVPTTFTLNASGGSGNYQYRIHSLTVFEGSEEVSVYDVSWPGNSPYTDSNTYSFTFYASGTYYIRFDVQDKNTYAYKSTGLREYVLNIRDSEHPSIEEITNTVAAQCQKECTTDFEKALWLHDWLLDHAEYDHSFSYCSAEGVLARGKGTCESYHRAYVMLLNKAGLAAGRIESKADAHVWTAVKMDGNWYQVDSTWDDMGAAYKGTYYEHMYFGLTDEIMGLVHTGHKSSVAGYESTALENNYFIRTGEIRQWSDPLAEQIEKKIAVGSAEFTLSVAEPMPDNYKNVIYNLVAYQLSKQDWGEVEVTASYKDSTLSVQTSAKPAMKPEVPSLPDDSGSGAKPEIPASPDDPDSDTEAEVPTLPDDPGSDAESETPSSPDTPDQKPVRPSGTKAASASYNSIKLNWKQSAGASGYEVYRATSRNGKYSKSGTVTKGTTVTYTDKKAVTGKTYYYKVRAYKASGKSRIYSAYSSVVSAKAVLSAPTVTVKKSSRASAKVSWKRISGASGYQVQMSTKKVSGFKTKATLKKGSTVSYKVTKLQKGKTYYFRVRAYRTVNGKKVYGRWSKVKSITVK